MTFSDCCVQKKMSKVALIHLIFMAHNKKHLTPEQKRTRENPHRNYRDQKKLSGLLSFGLMSIIWWEEALGLSCLCNCIKPVKEHIEPGRRRNVCLHRQINIHISHRTQALLDLLRALSATTGEKKRTLLILFTLLNMDLPSGNTAAKPIDMGACVTARICHVW